MNTRRLLLAALLLCASPALAKTVSVTGVVLDQSGTSAPTVQKLSFAAGETSEIDIAITHPDGTPYNLTGAQVLLAVNGSVISRQATIDNAAAGTAHVPLVIADTIGLLGVYTYDISVTVSSGAFYRAVPASSFVVTAGIGQPGQPVTVPASQQPLAQGPAGPTGPQGNPTAIANSGSSLPTEPTLNFTGTGVSCVDNSGSSRTDCTITAGGGSGTVTSVGMTVPSFMSVSGSPITTSGTLAMSLATESANTVMCGPTSGPAATPTFRALVAGDIPTLPESQITNLVSDLAGKVSAVTTQTKNTFLGGPTSGANAAPTFRALVDADMPADAATCTPTTAGDYCSWSGTTWQRTAAPGGGGTQGGTTTASHLPFASAGNTLSDTRIGYATFSSDGGKLTDNGGSSFLQLSTASGGTFGYAGGSHLFVGVGISMNDTVGSLTLSSGNLSLVGFDFSPDQNGTRTLGGQFAWKFVDAGVAAASLPTCTSSIRGAITDVEGAAGVADSVQMCMKGSADTYAWRVIFTAP